MTLRSLILMEQWGRNLVEKAQGRIGIWVACTVYDLEILLMVGYNTLVDKRQKSPSLLMTPVERSFQAGPCEGLYSGAGIASWDSGSSGKTAEWAGEGWDEVFYMASRVGLTRFLGLLWIGYLRNFTVPRWVSDTWSRGDLGLMQKGAGKRAQ